MEYFYENFEVGTKIVTRDRVVSGAEMELFAGLIGAYNPLFLSDKVARSKGFKGKIAPGPLIIAFSFGLEYQTGIFDNIVALLGLDEIRFKAPLMQGDSIRSELEVVDRRETRRSDRGIVTFQKKCFKGDEEIMEGKVTIMYLKRTMENI